MGHLYTLKKQGDQWLSAGLQGKVNLGSNGLAWGLGLHTDQTGPCKQEGDNKAPAGVFELGTAFGKYDHLITGLDYQPLDEGHYCIDSETSPFYNQDCSCERCGRKVLSVTQQSLCAEIFMRVIIFITRASLSGITPTISREKDVVFLFTCGEAPISPVPAARQWRNPSWTGF